MAIGGPGGREAEEMALAGSSPMLPGFGWFVSLSLVPSILGWLMFLGAPGDTHFYPTLLFGFALGSGVTSFLVISAIRRLCLLAQEM